eukprot:gene8377-10197_t
MSLRNQLKDEDGDEDEIQAGEKIRGFGNQIQGLASFQTMMETVLADLRAAAVIGRITLVQISP